MPANKKLSALTSATPAAGDYFYFAKDLGAGVFASRRSTVAGMLAALSGQSPTFAGASITPGSGNAVQTWRIPTSADRGLLSFSNQLGDRRLEIGFWGSTATSAYGWAANGAGINTQSSLTVSVADSAVALFTSTGLSVTGDLGASGAFGVNGATPLAKPTITGSRAGNAALANLLTQLALYGLITDATSA